MTVRQLEQKYGALEDPPASVLRRLRRDPRAGAHRLYRRLSERASRIRRERERLERMFEYERTLWGNGVERVAGVDEAGIGPMAGPVVAAAVVFPPDAWIDGIDDSKRLDPAAREEFDRRIRETATSVGIGIVEPADIDRLNVYHAGLKAMRLAVESLDRAPGHLLVDSRSIPGLSHPQSSFDKGDTLSFTIAAASIVAKVRRDRLMTDLDGQYPGYGLADHKGYCTPQHQAAVRKLGPSPIHRRSYSFVSELLGEYSPLFYELLGMAGEIRTSGDVVRLESRIRAHRKELSPAERRKLHLVVRRRRHRTRQ